jgi:hypothetical protein
MIGLWQEHYRTCITHFSDTSRSEAPRPQAGAFRARSGERKASQGNIVLIVPLNPAYKAGLAGHLPVKWLLISLTTFPLKMLDFQISLLLS